MRNPAGGALPLFESTVTVAVEVVPPVGVIEAGVTEHVPASTVVLQVSVMLWVNCAEGMRVTMNVVDWPAEMDADPGEISTPKSVPVPESAADWVADEAPAALSVTVRVPVAGPAAVGLKTTLMVQFCPMATVLPQVFVSLKGPEAAMLLMLKSAVPSFVNVTFMAELALIAA